jgi:hypothetical protein
MVRLDCRQWTLGKEAGVQTHGRNNADSACAQRCARLLYVWCRYVAFQRLMNGQCSPWCTACSHRPREVHNYAMGGANAIGLHVTASRTCCQIVAAIQDPTNSGAHSSHILRALRASVHSRLSLVHVYQRQLSPSDTRTTSWHEGQVP